jgi:IS30 family transposase
MKELSMPKGYHHLTYDKRCQIFALKKSGMSQNCIAKQIKVAQSTVSKELKRNSGQKNYQHEQAHKKSCERRAKASTGKRKLVDKTLYKVESMLKRKLSPEQISGRLLMVENIQISHESIYQHVWKDKKQGGKLYLNLRQQGKKRNKRGKKKAGRGLIPDRVGIEMRPSIVDQKTRIGDWEGDTIIGKNHRGAIVSMVERKTKLVRLYLLKSATAVETAAAINTILKPLKKQVKTITTDNGKEFAAHKEIAKKLNAQFYFARPYHSWERGLNENTNGLVRQFFPKSTDFTKLTHEDVRNIEKNLNSRPRKSLQFKTPNEEFLLLTGQKPTYALRG